MAFVAGHALGQGQWQPHATLSFPGQPDPCRATHAILYYNPLAENPDDRSKVLCIDQTYSDLSLPPFDDGRPDVIVVNWKTGAKSMILAQRAPSDHFMFCSGHAKTASNQVLVAGGGLPCPPFFNTVAFQNTFFDPATESLTPGPDEVWCVDDGCPGGTVPVERERWYPTVTLLPNKEMLIQHGEPTCDNPRIHTVVAANFAATGLDIWRPLRDARFSRTFAPSHPNYFSYGTYPHAFVLSNGSLL